MAEIAYLHDELNFEGLGILDEKSADTVEIQRRLEFNAQDVLLGTDT